MDRRKKPYTPGAGRKPDKLAGRDQDLRDFRGGWGYRAGALVLAAPAVAV
jgi:hypothetical protein